MAFAQIMKVYGGPRMVDIFSLNFVGPAYGTAKRDQDFFMIICGNLSRVKNCAWSRWTCPRATC